jgi:hypothetical protein
MQPEDLERIAAGVLREMPVNFSTVDVRDLFTELLFGFGMNPNDMPMFCLLLIDKYMADNQMTVSRD